MVPGRLFVKTASRLVTPAAVALLSALAALPAPAAGPAPQGGQIPLVRVDTMPNLPTPYHMRDWKQVARDLDATVYSTTATGQFLPIPWVDRTQFNKAGDMVAMPSYVGHPKMNSGPDHEGITNMAATVGGLLVGIPKSGSQGPDFAAMAHGYFNSTNGQNLYLNRVDTVTGQTFWYDLYPGILAWQIHALSPNTPGFDERLRKESDQLVDAVSVLAGGDAATSTPDFTGAGYDFRARRMGDNKQWKEPDGAAAFAWMLDAAWRKWKDPKYLAAAEASLRYLDNLPYDKNPYYEVLLIWAVPVAARLNAELGRTHDLHKYLSWVFGESWARPGFGVIADGPDGRWGEYDCHGLVGSRTDGGGYAFAMNGYAAAAALAPVARYDDRYARALGKWLLNLANNSRLYYGDALPPEKQTCFDWIRKHDPARVIAYEGLRAQWKGVSPRLMGDPLVHGWANTDLGLYGSTHVGMLGALVEKTNVDGILQVDLLPTDYFRGPAHPTWLVFNPHLTAKSVRVRLSGGTADLYEATSNRFLARRASGNARIEVPADSAFVLVAVPSGATLVADRNRTLANGVVIDYNNAENPLPAPGRLYDREAAAPRIDLSRALKAGRATIRVDGDARDWAAVSADPVTLDTHDRSPMEVSLRFAWDAKHLYILAQEQTVDTTRTEAADRAEYVKRFWDFDGFSLFFDLRNKNIPEDVKDLNLWFGFSSTGRGDLLCVRSHREPAWDHLSMPAARIATAGKPGGPRTVEAAIPWEEMGRLVAGHRQPGGRIQGAIKAGYRFGCEPLLLDDGWHAQSFRNGTGNSMPRGDDDASLDIVLEGQ